jgi:hypothetical protein
MITGCNTNILYRGRQFHVQTEDSGRANPHIISHVYHGGTIIASEKSEYGERLQSTELDIQVRAKIELQHTTMLKRLTSGALDAVIDERLGAAKVAAAAIQPPPASKESVAESTASGGATSGSITAGADTHPSIDQLRPAPDTQPMLGKSSAAAFGDSLDSDKPLDEVILEYLVDKARDRAAEKKQPSARQQRRKG